MASLHEGHKELIDHVRDLHNKVVIFLGMSSTKVTRNNPLDFEARKQMILDEYPSVIVLYIKDVSSDEVWGIELDSKIEDVIGPTSTVMLYGGRESFIDHYHGKYSTCEMEQEKFGSGTDERRLLSISAKSSPDFRAGVIWAAYNQYPKVHPTVDIAIWNDDSTKLLMARKPDETLYRFVGGFANKGESYETAARREAIEETSLEVSTPCYVGSSPVDDWRYRREIDSITTAFFECRRVFGKPTPRDDIVELRWFKALDIWDDSLVPNHVMLLDMLRNKNPGRIRDKENQ